MQYGILKSPPPLGTGRHIESATATWVTSVKLVENDEAGRENSSGRSGWELGDLERLLAGWDLGEGFEQQQRCYNCHSSFCSISMALTKRTIAASLGKMPTTPVRRLISWISRSRELVLHIPTHLDHPFRRIAIPPAPMHRDQIELPRSSIQPPWLLTPMRV